MGPASPSAATAGGEVAGRGWALYRPFLGLFGSIFASYLALAAFLPALPVWSRDALGIGGFWIGVAVTATAAAAFLTRPVAGALAERAGYRRTMVAGAILVALGSAGFLLPLPLPLAAVIALRLVQGVGEGAVFTAGAVWIVRRVPAERRGRLVGLYGLAMWSGITLGAIAGAALMQAVGVSAVWLFATAAPLVGGLGCLGVAAPPPVAQARRIVFLPRAAFGPGASLALAAAGFAALAAFAVLHLEARGVAGGVLALNAFSAAYVLVRLVLGDLPDRLGPRRVAVACAVVEAVGLAVVATAASLPAAVVGGLVMGAGFSLLYPALALIAIAGAPADQQGAALGAYTSFWDIGLGLSGPLLGAVAAAGGYPAAYWTAVGFALLAALTATGARLSR